MCCGFGTSYIVSVHVQCQASIYTLSLCRGHSWRLRLASRRRWLLPGTWSHLWLQGSVNVHRGALLLVTQWRCISSFVLYMLLCYVDMLICYVDMLLLYLDNCVIMLYGHAIMLSERVIVMWTCYYIMWTCYYVISHGHIIVMLCGYAFTLCGHITMWILTYIISKLLYVMWLLLNVLCKHHIIILINSSMTKITSWRWTWQISFFCAESDPGYGTWGLIQYIKFDEEKRERTDDCKGISDFVTELCNVPVYKK